MIWSSGGFYFSISSGLDPSKRCNSRSACACVTERTNFHSRVRSSEPVSIPSYHDRSRAVSFYRHKCRGSPGKVIRRGYPSFASEDAFCVPAILRSIDWQRNTGCPLLLVRYGFTEIGCKGGNATLARKIVSDEGNAFNYRMSGFFHETTSLKHPPVQHITSLWM